MERLILLFGTFRGRRVIPGLIHGTDNSPATARPGCAQVKRSACGNGGAGALDLSYMAPSSSVLELPAGNNPSPARSARPHRHAALLFGNASAPGFRKSDQLVEMFGKLTQNTGGSKICIRALGRQPNSFSTRSWLCRQQKLNALLRLARIIPKLPTQVCIREHFIRNPRLVVDFGCFELPA